MTFANNAESLAAIPELPAADYFASKPSRAFIRVLWGAMVLESRCSKVRRDAIEIQKAPHVVERSPPVMNYVFGQENYDFLVSHGFHCVLMSRHPRPHAGNDDGGDHAWIHKSQGWLAATEDFEEVISMDWDTIPLEKISTPYVFNKLRAKSDFGAHLLQYKHMVAPWRGGRIERKLKPSACFVYLGNHGVAKGIHEAMRYLQNVMREPSGTEEAGMAMYYDNRYGGFQGRDHWVEKHETFCSICPKCWAIPEHLAKAMSFVKEPLFTPTFPRYKW
jgi:hypothetical protein